MSKPPHSQIDVRQLFNYLEIGQVDQFLCNVPDDVKWRVIGPHRQAGKYRSKDDFLSHTFRQLSHICPDRYHELVVNNLIILNHWAIAEMKLVSSISKGRSIISYEHWLIKFIKNYIVEVRVYLDASLTAQISAGTYLNNARSSS